MPLLSSRELPNMLRVADVAAYLDICSKSAYQLVKTPGFPRVVLNKKWFRIPRDAFFEWLEAQPGIKDLIAARQSPTGQCDGVEQEVERALG